MLKSTCKKGAQILPISLFIASTGGRKDPDQEVAHSNGACTLRSRRGREVKMRSLDRSGVQKRDDWVFTPLGDLCRPQTLLHDISILPF